MTHSLARGVGLVALLLALGCNGDTGPAPPVPGPLRVVLTTPNADDGAVMFQILGVVDSAVAPAGVTIYRSVPGPNALRVIATGGTLTTGTNLLTLYVPDVAKVGSISTYLLQVAQKVTWAQRTLGGYSLKVQK